MIQSFADQAAETFFRTGKRPKTGWQHVANLVARKLDLVDGADALSDLASPPKNCLEALIGDRKGQHSIRVNDQWRICFVWTAAGPSNVEITDYHD